MGQVWDTVDVRPQRESVPRPEFAHPGVLRLGVIEGSKFSSPPSRLEGRGDAPVGLCCTKVVFFIFLKQVGASAQMDVQEFSWVT